MLIYQGSCSELEQPCFLFAPDVDTAFKIFAAFMEANQFDLAESSLLRVPITKLAGVHLRYAREALQRGVTGLARLEPGLGWVIMPVAC